MSNNISTLFGDKKVIEESIGFLNVFRDFGSIASNVFMSDGAYWEVTSGSGAPGAFFTAFYWLATTWFNRMQRYASRFAYLSNGYAQTAVNDLAVLALGEGFQYTSQQKTTQRKLDEWLEKNNWHERSLDFFKEYLIDGENFIRVFGDIVRKVDPDQIFGDSEPRQDYYQGVLFNNEDQELVLGYQVRNAPYGGNQSEAEEVSAKEMQHRANKLWGMKRGLSHMLPVLTDLFQADKLTTNLMHAAEVLSKFAVYRKVDAVKPAAEKLVTDIAAQARNFGPPIGVNGGPVGPDGFQNSEYYPPGSIVTTPESVSMETPGTTDFSRFIVLLDATLRKISSQFFLPVSIFAQNKGEQGGYASEVASSSWEVRCIKRLQDRWKAWDLALMKMCGIDISKVDVQAPEIALPNKLSQAKLAEFLIEKRMASKSTVAKMFDIDYDEEIEKILAEDKKDPQEHEENVQGNMEKNNSASGEPRMNSP